MAETTHNPKVLHIQKPLQGQSSVLAVDPGSTIYLEFPLGEAQPVLQDGNLIFRFENGGQVELLDFDQALPTTELVLSDGTEATGDQILAAIGVGSGEPAAGAPPPSGGVGEYGDDLGSITDGIDRLGALDPRDFGTPPEYPDIRAEGIIEPPESLQAFDDTREFTVETIYDEFGNRLSQFYDIDLHGNVLDNDVPTGEVDVVGFQVDDLPGSLANLDEWVDLPSGAQFRLSENGSYDYVYENSEIVSDVDQFLQHSGITDSIEFMGIAPGYEALRLHFSDVDSLDRLKITWIDQAGNLEDTTYRGGFLVGLQGNVSHVDRDGIKDIQIDVERGEVTFDSLEVIDIDANLGQETINYTIADANGNTSSAVLTFIDSQLLNPDTSPPAELT